MAPPLYIALPIMQSIFILKKPGTAEERIINMMKETATTEQTKIPFPKRQSMICGYTQRMSQRRTAPEYMPETMVSVVSASGSTAGRSARKAMSAEADRKGSRNAADTCRRRDGMRLRKTDLSNN